MGMCYYVTGYLKTHNQLELINKINQFIDEYSQGKAVFNTEDLNRADLVDLTKIIFTKSAETEIIPAGISKCLEGIGGVRFTSKFDASYGWETVMLELFKYVSAELTDGSELYVYPDSGYTHLAIANGKVNEENDFRE